MEPTSSQLIALFAAWRRDIDSEPFAYEDEWAIANSLRFRADSPWAPQPRAPESYTTPPLAQPAHDLFPQPGTTD